MEECRAYPVLNIVLILDSSGDKHRQNEHYAVALARVNHHVSTKKILDEI
jgi:hypothetical protein